MLNIQSRMEYLNVFVSQEKEFRLMRHGTNCTKMRGLRVESSQLPDEPDHAERRSLQKRMSLA